jgi:hypothetical protein
MSFFLAALSIWIFSGMLTLMGFIYLYCRGPVDAFYWVKKTFNSDFNQYPAFFTVPFLLLLTGIFGLIAVWVIFSMMWHISRENNK